MAGLLTDSLPDSFPTLTIYTRSVVKVNIKKLNRVSQQRDCPGFSPDSLLFLVPDDNKKTSMEQRYEKNEMLIQVFLLF